MSVELKIRNPAPRDGQALCHSCSSGLVLRGCAESEEAIFCNFGDPLFRVPFRVCDCTGYINREQAPLYKMEDAATVLTVPIGRRAGFPLPNGNDHKK